MVINTKQILTNLSLSYAHFRENNREGTLEEFIKNEVKTRNTGLMLLKKYLVAYHNFSSAEAARLIAKYSIEFI
ncbi:hypothetical protein BKI52_38955 [marine bacterium AO1-C]|nr:hypothetical protein BKI52_38955 [marine bacterium AO1-C]